MTKEYGVTHFTELHRILHKYFLIRRCQRRALGFIYFIILVNPCFALYVTTLANSRYRALSSAYADGLLVKTAIKTNACHKAGAWLYIFYYTREPVLRTLCLLLRSKRSLVNNA